MKKLYLSLLILLSFSLVHADVSKKAGLTISDYSKMAGQTISGLAKVAGQTIAASIPPLQDIDTDYTEVDPGTELSANDTTITFNYADSRVDTGYFWRDMGVDYFSEDFRFYVDVSVSVSDWYSIVYVVALSDQKDDAYGDGSNYFQGFRVYTNDSSVSRIDIIEHENGVEDISAGYNISLSTTYYIDFYRDDSVGTYGTLYTDIYTSAANRTAGTSAVANLSLALGDDSSSRQDFRYLLLATTFADNFSAGREKTGTAENYRFDTSLW